MAEPQIQIGTTYQFNLARAQVLKVDCGVVVWADLGTKRRTKRRVPAWFFRKYAIRKGRGFNP